MYFNEKELKKIKKKNSGNSQHSTREVVAEALRELNKQVGAFQQLPKVERQSELIALLNEATATRHRALAMGATSYKDPQWAAAAACESWIAALIDNERGEINQNTFSSCCARKRTSRLGD